MCHDPHAAPPAIPDPAGASFPVSAADETLTSSDGTVFAVHRAAPVPVSGLADLADAHAGAAPEDTAILILPDNRGLTGFYRTLAARLAGRGHHTLAIDYFARTAGTDLTARAAGFEPMRHLAAASRETLFADIGAALEDLRGRADRVFAVGFCFGGRLAFLTADARFALAGVVGFYGFPGVLFGTPGPTQLAAAFTAPVLGLFGAEDHGIDAACRAEFGAALASAGVAHDLVVFPGVGHSFFEAAADPEFVPFDTPAEGNKAPAEVEHAARVCAHAWSRVVAFIERAGEPGV